METDGFGWWRSRSSALLREPSWLGMLSLPSHEGLAGKRISELESGDGRQYCRHFLAQLRRGLSPVSPLSPNQPTLHLGSHIGYRWRPVSAHRIGTTVRSCSLMAVTDRLPVVAFWICSLHQAIIGRRRRCSPPCCRHFGLRLCRHAPALIKTCAPGWASMASILKRVGTPESSTHPLSLMGSQSTGSGWYPVKGLKSFCVMGSIFSGR